MPNAKPFSPSPASISHMQKWACPSRSGSGPAGDRGYRLDPRNLARGRQHERHVPSKGDAAVATAGEERPGRGPRRPDYFVNLNAAVVHAFGKPLTIDEAPVRAIRIFTPRAATGR